MGWVMGGDTGGARAGLGLNQDHIFRPWKARTGAQWWGDSREPSLVCDPGPHTDAISYSEVSPHCLPNWPLLPR